MTREEAIEVLRRLPIGLMDLSYEQKSELTEALNIAITALRGQTVTTNADYIRAMDDEELACQLVIDVYGLEPCALYLSTPTGKMYLIRTDAVNKVKEWLQQPYKMEAGHDEG